MEELTEYEKQVARKRKLIGKHQDQLNELLKECPHEHIEEKSQYFSGTYYDRSYTEYWNACRCCGETSKRVQGEYGGYS